MKLFYASGSPYARIARVVVRELALGDRVEEIEVTLRDPHSTLLPSNPGGKVPALQLDDGQILTENAAILSYVAKKFGNGKMWPNDPVTEARAIATMAWFSNTVHPAFAHFVRPERFTADPAGADKVKEQGKKTFWGCLQEIDKGLAGKEWVLGSQFTVCDPYALVFYGWGLRAELPMTELTNYTALKDRLLKRPAVRKILEREQSLLLKAA
jgi:glutathione S-transferase